MKYTLWSSTYLEQEVSNYNCYLVEKDWKLLTDQYESKRLFARITTINTSWICCLGSPIKQEDIISPNPLYVPFWMLEQIDLYGNGEEFEIEWIPAETLDNSQLIILRPLDSAFQYGDVKEQLQNELTKLGVLQKNTFINLQIEALDGYEVSFYVSHLEPCDVVLCQGDEVVIDFEESLDNIQEEEKKVEEKKEVFALPPPAIPVSEEEVRTLGGIKREGRYNPWRLKETQPTTNKNEYECTPTL